MYIRGFDRSSGAFSCNAISKLASKPARKLT